MVSNARQGQVDRDKTSSEWANSLAQPTTKGYQFYKRVRLFPWWIRYNIGIAGEAKLRKMIIEQGCAMGLQDRWIQRAIRHAVSEFSKKGLGSDYYGYHNINHELEATYVSLLAANGYNNKNRNNQLYKEDIM